MHVFGRCLNHDEPKSNAWAHHNCLNLVCYEWTQAQRPVIELYFVWKPKIVSWIILSPPLEPIKGVYAWSTSNAKSSQDACLPSASLSHFIIIKAQAHQALSILNGPRRSKWSNFALLHIWFVTSWLSLKFVCLFHVSMLLWILKIHVGFDVLC